MINWSGLISKDTAWELTLFHKIRSLSDGLSLVDFELDGSWYEGDHQPSYGVHLVLFNWTIFEFRIYNINHVG
jgi:hypothetical protein